MTEICRAKVFSLGPEFEKAWQEVSKECSGTTPNIEQILSKIRHKIEAIGPADTLLGLNKAKLELLEGQIRQTIAALASPSETRIPASLPHHLFAEWVKIASKRQPVEIFTPNYDVLFERALESTRIPLFDGFVGSHEPFFISEAAEHGEPCLTGPHARIWKIHGSVNWTIKSGPDGRRIVRGGVSGAGEMILPSHRKYDESRRQPYVALLGRMAKVLAGDDVLMVTSGYSFSDEHINAVLFEGMDRKPRTHVAALMFSEVSPSDELVKHAMRRKNLMILAPNGGVIAGQWGTWLLSEPVDARTASFMDVAFDSDGAMPSGPALTGTLRLGNFNWFCRFLSAMDDGAVRT
jgi:hypothetical protein